MTRKAYRSNIFLYVLAAIRFSNNVVAMYEGPFESVSDFFRHRAMVFIFPLGIPNFPTWILVRIVTAYVTCSFSVERMVCPNSSHASVRNSLNLVFTAVVVFAGPFEDCDRLVAIVVLAR
jgi:hypothetical protein